MHPVPSELEETSVNGWSPDGPPPGAELRPSPGPSEENKPRFCRIPAFIVQEGLWASLSFSEAMLFVAFCYHANRKHGFRAWPRLETLRRETGLHPETIRLARNTLRDKGLISFRRVPTRGGGSFMCTWVATEKAFHFSGDHATYKGHEG